MAKPLIERSGKRLLSAREKNRAERRRVKQIYVSTRRDGYGIDPDRNRKEWKTKSES